MTYNKLWEFTTVFLCAIGYYDGSIRFTPERRAQRPQLCHLPFGFGPRSCIGMRFALLEAKMALIELLKKYTFIRAPDTEVLNVYRFIWQLVSFMIFIHVGSSADSSWYHYGTKAWYLSQSDQSCKLKKKQTWTGIAINGGN